MNCRELLADVRSTGLTQSEVAARLDMTQSHISKIERGEVKDMKASSYRKLELLRGQVMRDSEKPSIVANAAPIEAAGGLAA